jgi:ABC-type multidrug transport system ATPase subunit
MGYETIVGERGLLLSGGERQKIALARALLKSCPILILDEATANLDLQAENTLYKLVKGISPKPTIILVAHRLSAITGVDKIIVLDHGSVIETGKHIDLYSKNGSALRVISLPYLMIQPRIKSSEYKVLVVNGKAKSVTNGAFGFKSTQREIFDFAERVVQRLKEKYPETLVEYIIRVDIFEHNGELKLNEFESFDADFLNKSVRKRKIDGDDKYFEKWDDSHSLQFIEIFWEQKLDQLITEKLNL